MDLIVKLREIFFAGNGQFVALNDYLASHFGRAFQVGVDWVLLGLALVFLLRLFKFSFDVLRYVLVPSLLVSGLLATYSSLSFSYVMPFAMGVGTVFMLFKS